MISTNATFRAVTERRHNQQRLTKTGEAGAYVLKMASP